MKKKSPVKKSPNKGFALIVALVALLVLSTLAASVLMLTQIEITTSYNYKRLTQARYAAEAGLQSAQNYLTYTYSAPTVFTSYDLTKSPVQFGGVDVVLSAMNGAASNYPTGAVQTAFNTALLNKAVPGMGVNVSYGVTATLLSMQQATFLGGSSAPMQTWLIRSRGSIAGSEGQVELVTTIERTGTPVFKYAVFGTSAACDSVTFGGGGGSDSYDSSGTYAATKLTSGGDLGSNGNIGLGGGGGTTLTKQIYGTLNTPMTGTGNCSVGAPDALSIGSGWTIGTLNQLAAPVTYTTISTATGALAPAVQNIRNNCNTITGCSCYPGGGWACTNSGPYMLAPGAYADASLGGGKTVHLSAGTYNFNSFSLNGTIIIDSGPVVLKAATTGIGAGVCCAVDFSGGTVVNSSGIPSNFQIIYGGTALIKMTGGSGASQVIYAPNSDVSIGGGGEVFGAIIGKTVANGGGSAIHYDRQLTSGLVSGGTYHATNFTWNRY